MTAKKRRMHLAVFWLGTGNHAAGWRMEGAADSNCSWPILEAGAFGARNRAIHWAQEMFDQAGMVRELVKWDYEMRSPDQAHLVVPRALEAALANPSGPVYLALPREPLSAPVSAAVSSPASRGCSARR